LQEYLKRDVDPSKLVLSVPAYGHSYTLVDPELHGLGEEAVSVGTPGPYTRSPGVLSFHEVSFFLSIDVKVNAC
jgi:chitinase